MDITKLLADLYAERDDLDAAIHAFEALALGSGKRRGRPPAWMAKMKELDAPVKESAQAKLGKNGANN